MINVTSEEILQFLKEETSISKEELKKRKQAYVFLMKQGEITIFSGAKANKEAQWIDSHIGAVDENIIEFTGQPTSPGKARGKVHIALFAKNSKSLKEGEVLVCSMTSPEYVPAMKKAVAIVTDEGGLLSHAAIIPRELGKPCVVGTKIATRVLKDGDFVEVDANKGVVRKIEK